MSSGKTQFAGLLYFLKNLMSTTLYKDKNQIAFLYQALFCHVKFLIHSGVQQDSLRQPNECSVLTSEIWTIVDQRGQLPFSSVFPTNILSFSFC